jgi:photosystem II stability/assembly factor-like uncharacterized protein
MKKISTIAILLFLCFIAFSQDTANWESTYGPRFRHVQAVHVLKNFDFIGAGGWEANDAISTIVQSSDRGNSWNMPMDSINAILQDIYFATDHIAYTVGWSGNAFKSVDKGANWTPLSIQGNAGNRNFNACHFFNATTGIVVGGNESNDSIQTILKTTDGGQNWSVIKDNLGYWLLSVHFANLTDGYATGPYGTIIKSADGGNNWTKLTLSGNLANRVFTDIHVFDINTAVAVGGWYDNDSIQTIIKTTDGGANWSIIKDNLGSMLYAIDFYSATEGYAVGDDGTILYTSDAGENWQPILLEGEESAELRAVDFRNEYIGLIGGRYGKLIWYEGEMPPPPDKAIAQLVSTVQITSTTSALVQGQVNPMGSYTSIEFEYGFDTSFGQIATMTPASSDLDTFMNVHIHLQDLALDKNYFGRIKASNSGGISYSDTISFYTGLYEIPNYGFELWDEYKTLMLDDWFTTIGNRKITSYDGSNAIELYSANDMEPGAMLLGDYNDQTGFSGGIPYSDKPDSLTAMLNYELAANDTAIVILKLKKDGILLLDTFYQITGSSGGNFVRKAFNLNYSNPTTPDSLILGFVNTNFFGGQINQSSTLAVDDIIFIGATQSLPNSSCENWTEKIRYKPQNWISDDDNDPYYNNYLVNRSENSYKGKYALLLKNRPGDRFGRIISGDEAFKWVPSFPLKEQHKNLFTYIDFSTQGEDSLYIYAQLYKNGQAVGSAESVLTQNTNGYELIQTPIYYWANKHADSIRIEFNIRNRKTNIPSETEVYIDNISFDGLIAQIEDKSVSENNISVYPIPAHDQLNILFNDPVNGKSDISLYNLNGKVVKQIHATAFTKHVEINITELDAGYYLLMVTQNNKAHTTKILVQ